jgi:cyclopropane fatty-acyl-phospholipid synthase-like methyltransferase
MKFYLETEYPVALDSLDHVYPLGTRMDNTTNLEFNKRVYALYPGKTISILDLGCAGGGMVKTFADNGHNAVGLEGSDYNYKHKRSAWLTNPGNLFTCDVSKPFILHNGDRIPYQFDVITAWEFLEHIYEHYLPVLFMNINNHLKPDGLFIGTTTKCDPSANGVRHHVTRHDLNWWTDRFNSNELFRDRKLERYFDGGWVRSITKNNFVCRGSLL